MKRNDILFLLASTVILAIAWIVFNILHTSLTSTLTDTVIQQIAPIKPTFDTQTVNALKKREQITPEFTNTGIVTSPTPTPIPNIVVPIIASGSSQQASTGGSQQ